MIHLWLHGVSNHPVCGKLPCGRVPVTSYNRACAICRRWAYRRGRYLLALERQA